MPGLAALGEVAGKVAEGTADRLFRTYMSDPDKRHTLLNRHFKVVGVATVSTDDNGSTVSWNTIDFANSCD